MCCKYQRQILEIRFIVFETLPFCRDVETFTQTKCDGKAKKQRCIDNKWKRYFGNCSGESRYLIKAIYIHEITVETISKLRILLKAYSFCSFATCIRYTRIRCAGAHALARIHRGKVSPENLVRM